MNTAQIGNEKDVIVLYQSPQAPTELNVKFYYKDNLSFENEKFLFAFDTTSQHNNLGINQIETVLFEPENHQFHKLNQNVYTAINCGKKKVQNLEIEIKFKPSQNDPSQHFIYKIKKKLLYDINFINEHIYFVQPSSYIKGECLILCDDKIYLANELNSNPSNDLNKIAQGIQPLFSSESPNKNVKFGSNPRQFVYMDHSQIFSIDSRVKSSSQQNKLFTLPNKHLNSDELIYMNKIIEDTYNLQLVFCSKSICAIDDRFPNRPLLMWKNMLKQDPIYLNCIRFNSDINLMIYGDKSEIYAEQFSLKLSESPQSLNHTQKLLTRSELSGKKLMSPLPNLNYSTINYSDSFDLFEVFI